MPMLSRVAVAAGSRSPSSRVQVHEERLRNGSSPREGRGRSRSQQRRRRRRVYQHFLHGVPMMTLILRLHGAATTLETAVRTWCPCPGLRFPAAAAAGTTASATADVCGCATPSSLFGAALHGDGGDDAGTVRMRASSRVAAELWRMETSPGVGQEWRTRWSRIFRLYICRLRMLGWRWRRVRTFGCGQRVGVAGHLQRPFTAAVAPCLGGSFAMDGARVRHGSRMGEAISHPNLFVYKCIYMSIP